MNKQDNIIIRGARENNLKDVSLKIPKHQITIFTGVSGSGKSSLVLDTIAAKSRRELNDTFPTFVQQYLPKYGRPHVDAIEGLPIAIVIDQKKPANNSRSTVGTYTDIYALIRLLFSRVGKPFVGYAESFSFNHPEGSCPRCSGLGEIRELDIHKLVDFDKSLNDEDTIHYIAFGKGGWRWIRYAHSGLFDLDKKIRDYSPEELELFLNSPQIRLKNPPSNWPKSAKYEGLIPRMYRSIINSEEGLLHAAVLNPMLRMGTCPDCGGTRLSPRVLSCKIEGKNIAEVCSLSITKLNRWIRSLTDPLAIDLKAAIGARLTALEEIGLGYLSLDRAVGTLSGGEAQRCNHKEMIRIADYIVDMGPGPGIDGGRIVFQGTYDQLLKSGTSTGEVLGKSGDFKSHPREIKAHFPLCHATLHNLKDVSINLPLGIFGVVAGVAGSGKSSLMECFRHTYPQPEQIVYISQKNIGVSLRSTPATYMDVAGDIRKIFAKRHKKKETCFAFNGQGACPVCGGKGVIISEMAFMDNIETVCEACGGLRYSKEALQYTIKGEKLEENGQTHETELNIAEVMDLSVRLASTFFKGTAIEEKLRPMMSVGLGYLHLNQALSTLSGGELQRLKMASYLGEQGKIFIVDEPTDGLHLKDVHRIITLFETMVDKGNTVYVIEHNTDVIKAADYVIELGPGAGEEGGEVIYAGTPQGLLSCTQSVTARYLADQ